MSGTTSATKINEIFYREITREINEVVKVDNDDPELAQQELEEYILTPQLEQYFLDALEAITDTEHNQTEDIGMWISGFFGSGKSHFMKILGYILENEELPRGNTASEIFTQRTENEMLRGSVGGVNRKFDSEVMMFQIGAKADATEAESITEIIHREFNIQRGYAAMPWVAALEEDLEAEGRYEAFKEAIEEQRGEPWEEVRTRAAFLRPHVKQALAACTPAFDEEDAEQAIEDVEEGVLINATTLTKKILDHVERKEEETENDHRYFVFIDEISQFIGDDQQNILTLQSIVEEFGRQGQGKLWLGVTSQEELKELVEGVLVNQEEQNKVRDRFPNRYNLRSEDLDKIVRERILQKDPQYHEELRQLVNERDGTLSARYKIDSGRDLKEISRKNFIECYPFLPYQLDILPAIFGALRGEGSDDRLTGRERTLIDVTQSVLKDSDLLYNSQLGELVTLDLIFDEIKEEIPDADVSSIEEAAPKDADNELARRVLKSLYLLQELDWVPNTANNIATTLQGKITDASDLTSLHQDVDEALDALVEAGYVGRSEEGYRIPRETERKLENEIKSVDIRPGDVRRFSKRLLNDLLDRTTSVRYESQSFDVTVEVDGETLSTGGRIFLQAYSPIQQLYEDIDERTLKQQSFSQEDTVYWIADAEDAADLKSDLERIQQVEQTLRNKRSEQLSEQQQDAVAQKQEDVNRLQNEVERRLRDAFRKGTVIYNGTATELNESNKNLDSIISDPVTEAIPRVFTKLEHGLANVKDRHLEQIFGALESTSAPSVFRELDVVLDGELNPEARIASEVEDEIQQREQDGEDRTGSDLVAHFGQPPYGWSRDVVRLATAVLFRNGSIVATHQERPYENYTDDGATELFEQVSKFKHTSFDERETVDPDTRNTAKQLLDRLFDKKVKRTDQAVEGGIGEVIDTWTNWTTGIKRGLERVQFPLLGAVDSFETRLQNLDQQPTAAKRIKQFVEFEDGLEQLTPHVKAVKSFVEADRLETYDTYATFLNDEWSTLIEQADETPDHVTVSAEARKAADKLDTILSSEQVVNDWTNAQTEYQKAAQAYASAYTDLYEQRHEVYTDAIGRVQSYADGELEESDLKAALQPLASRLGNESISLDVSAGDHLDRSPDIGRLVEHIQTVDSYEKQAREAVDRRRPEDTVHKTVDLQSIFGSETITDIEELEEPIDELRDAVATALDEEEDVEVRFS